MAAVIDKKYEVHIVAEDQDGNEIKFDELVTYYGLPNNEHGCIHESKREGEAIRRVRNRMSHLNNVRAKGSCCL